METKFIIFDLDGVVLDSEPSIRNSVDAALATVDQPPVSKEEIRLLIGPPLLDGIKSLLVARKSEVRFAPIVLEVFRDDYEENGIAASQLFEGVNEALKQLKEEGGMLAVATSKPLRFTLPILEHLGLSGYFFDVGAPQSGKEGETKTETLSGVISRNPSINFNRGSMVGDRGVDMKAAVDCGLQGIGALWGYGSLKELSDAGAVAFAQTASGLPSLLATL
jgi:phosphoglycolate phosphatase